MSENREYREKISAALRRAAEKYGKRGAPGIIQGEMANWAIAKAGADDDPGDAPSFNTVRKWLADDPAMISGKHVDFVEHFLRENYRSALLTPTTDLKLQREIKGFFGQRTSDFEREKQKLTGTWVMYRQLSTDEGKYIASCVTIGEGEAGILIARDEVLIDNDEDERGWIEETWDGFLVTTREFSYFLFRTPDRREMRVSNAKFILIDHFEEQKSVTDDRTNRYFRMQGQTLIGVNRIGTSDMFETVLQRVQNVENEHLGVFTKDELPKDIKKDFDQRNKIMFV